MIDKTRNQFSMNMAIFLVLLSPTRWTCLSDDHSVLLPPLAR